MYDEGNPGCKTYLPQQSPKGFLYEDLWRRHEEADRQKAECAGEDRYSVKILLKFAVCFFRALLVFRCYLLHDDHMDNCEKTSYSIMLMTILNARVYVGLVTKRISDTASKKQ